MNPSHSSEAVTRLDLATLLSHASWPVVVTVVLLLVASTGVWVIGVLKLLQVARLRAGLRSFELAAQRVRTSDELRTVLRQQQESPGSRVLWAILYRDFAAGPARLRAAAGRAILDEKQRARMLMTVLASIGSTAPFVGLFGTVYGIMDAFVRIGAARSAALPVVAPAIGEALVTTAIGLSAAIPAMLFYNALERQILDFSCALEASAEEWVAVIAAEAEDEQPASRRRSMGRVGSIASA